MLRALLGTIEEGRALWASLLICSGGGVALALGALLAVSAAPTAARADAAGAFEVTGGAQGEDYAYSDGVLTVSDGADITVSMTDGSTEPTSGRIVVAANATATITLNGVSVTGPGPDISSGAPAQSAIDVGENAHLILNLKDETSNVLTGGSGGTDLGAPGIHVPSSASLVVQGSGGLSVQGGSSTTTYGGNGIGGKPNTQQSGGACGTVIILATGNVTVTGGTGQTSSSGGADIGGGLGTTYGGNGQGIRPESDQENTYTVWGDLTLPCDITIPAGATVTIPEGASLTVPQGTTLTNSGTILVQGGSFTGKVEGNQPTYPSKVTVSFSQDGKFVSSAPYGSTVTITATMEKAETAINALSVDSGTVDFYLGTLEGGTKLIQDGVPVTQDPDGACVATFDVTLDGDSWKPGHADKSITADFGGYVSVSGTGVSLAPNTGSAQLTVVKASQPFPADGVGYSVDYVGEAVIAEDGYELAASADAAEGSGTLAAVPGESFYVRVVESETHEPSDWTQVDVAARPAAPEVDKAFTVAEPDVTGGEGVIAPIDGAQLEYRIGSEGAWADLPAEGIACTAGERLEFRHKAGASTFASEIASVTVPDHTHVGGGAWKSDADGHWRICGSAACGERVDQAPHTFGDWNATVAASCTEAGEEVRVCTVCGYAETRPAPALGHLWGDWVTEKKPTYDTEGEEVRTCSLCGETESRVLERLTDGAEGDGPSRPAHEAEGDRGDSSGPATGVIPSTGDAGTGAAVFAASAALGTLALGIVCRRRS